VLKTVQGGGHHAMVSVLLKAAQFGTGLLRRKRSGIGFAH
jgi:hypothetical protein